jgi:hypothetical protein
MPEMSVPTWPGHRLDELRSAEAQERVEPLTDAAANGLDTNTELCGNGSQANPANAGWPVHLINDHANGRVDLAL